MVLKDEGGDEDFCEFGPIVDADFLKQITEDYYREFNPQDGNNSSESEVFPTVSSKSTEEPLDESKFEQKRFFLLPRQGIPQERKEALPCVIVGFDTYGFAYLRFQDELLESQHQEMLVSLKALYDSRDMSLVDTHLSHLVKGEVLVVKEGDEYFRGMFKLIDPQKEECLMINIDEQTQHCAKFRNVFCITEDFYEFPTMTVKCWLRHLEPFMGTLACVEGTEITDCQQTEMMAVIIEDEKWKDGIPLVDLYPTQEEALSREWSFNCDILAALLQWNARPLRFKKGMIVKNIRITHGLPTGHIWIQIESGVMDLLSQLQPIVDLSIIPPDEVMDKVQEQMSEKEYVFIARYQKGPIYLRVQIISKIETTEELFVEFIDYGLKEILHIKELLPMEYFGSALKYIPPQAFQAELFGMGSVRLHEEDLKGMIQSQQMQTVKIMDEGTDNCRWPTVIVYFMPWAKPQKESISNNLKYLAEGKLITFASHGFPGKRRKPGRCFDYSKECLSRQEEGQPHWDFFSQDHLLRDHTV